MARCNYSTRNHAHASGAVLAKGFGGLSLLSGPIFDDKVAIRSHAQHAAIVGSAELMEALMSAGYDILDDGETSWGHSARCASSRRLFKRALYKPVKKGPFVLFNPFETGQHVDAIKNACSLKSLSIQASICHCTSPSCLC